MRKQINRSQVMESGMMLKTFEFVTTFGAVEIARISRTVIRMSEPLSLHDPTEHEVHPASGARSYHAESVQRTMITVERRAL